MQSPFEQWFLAKDPQGRLHGYLAYHADAQQPLARRRLHRRFWSEQSGFVPGHLDLKVQGIWSSPRAGDRAPDVDLLGSSLCDLIHDGHLHLLLPLWLMSFHLDWGVLARQWLNILSVPLVAALSIGLTVSSLEIFSGSSLDPNREMSVSGLANMASCLSGGLTGFHAPVDTMLSVQLGSRGRIPALVSVVVVGAVLWSGPDLLQEVPHFVLGGFILYLGLHFSARVADRGLAQDVGP